MLEWLFGDRRIRRLEWKFTQLERKVGRIMATQAELAQGLDDLTAQVAKIGTETETLKTKVSDLEAALAANPVSPEVQAKFDALKAQVQAVDDAVPDAEPPTP